MSVDEARDKALNEVNKALEILNKLNKEHNLCTQYLKLILSFILNRSSQIKLYVDVYFMVFLSSLCLKKIINC